MPRNKSHHAFTLVEILVIVSLIIILSISVISIINPSEQKNKASDAKLKTLISEIFKAHLRYSQYGEGSYLTTPVVASQINLPESMAFLETLVSAEELKRTTISDSNMNRILLTTDSLDNVTLCFLPKAKANLSSSDTHYDNQGVYRSDCSDLQCYFCLSTEVKENFAEITTVPSPTPDPCSVYSRNRPNFPYTTDFADKYTDLGCTNFNIQDRGCDSYCPSGQRHLIKWYSSKTLNPLCTPSLKEDYCVSEPYADCLNHPSISGDIDFNWGCTNPRRPYSWK